MELKKEQLLLPIRVAKGTVKGMGGIAVNTLTLIHTFIDPMPIHQRLKAEEAHHTKNLTDKELVKAHCIERPDGKQERLSPCLQVMSLIAKRLVKKIETGEMFLEEEILEFKQFYARFLQEYPEESLNSLYLEPEKIAILEQYV